MKLQNPGDYLGREIGERQNNDELFSIHDESSCNKEKANIIC